MIYNVPTGVESGHKSPKENIKTDLILPMAQEWLFFEAPFELLLKDCRVHCLTLSRLPEKHWMA